MLIKLIICLCMSYILSSARVNGHHLFVGDECTINGSKIVGVCKLLRECEPAISDLQFKSITPTKCGFNNSEIIACCPVVKQTTIDVASPPKQEQKCKQYGGRLNQPITPVALINVVNEQKEVYYSCTKLFYYEFAITDVDVWDLEAPHSALLGFRDARNKTHWNCGGSLVSSRYVLTAAHCIRSSVLGDVVIVRLGENEIDSVDDAAPPIDVAIEKLFPHPNFRITSHYNDIALIKLAQQIEFSPYIRPICLPTIQHQKTGCFSSGWHGQSTWGTPNKTLLKQLMETISNDECDQIYRANASDYRLPRGIIDSQICAKMGKHGDTTCVNERGAPLQVYHRDINCSYIQIGIASLQNACVDPINQPVVFTNVFNYVEWIMEIIWAPGEDE